jgi:hypothetical protein
MAASASGMRRAGTASRLCEATSKAPLSFTARREKAPTRAPGTNDPIPRACAFSFF